MIEPYMITGTEEIIRWDTWEELVLGGAVLRHGTRAWDAIAAELQARTLRPLGFTAEACKDKFKELQERFSGCRAWFEELRKQRVAELKRDLEISEDSIGSLQSKLESLKSEKGEDRRFDFDSSRTESPATFGNSSEVAEFPGKEASKDGLSAGSFTEETPANLPEYQNPAMVSAQETNTKTESSDDRERDKIADVEKPVEVVGIAGGVSVRKKRGKRKRRDCNRDVNEGSVGENDVLSSATVATIPDKEESTGDYDRGIISSDDDRNGRCGEVEVVELMAILDSVMENQNASVFRRRLDSQRRSRYKKTVRRHLDFDTIRSRIVDRSITSAGELFRDMLLLATNAVVFYPKHTRQFKSALSLRELVKKTFRHIDGESCRGSGVAAVAAAPIVGEPSTRNPTVKPRSVRPYNRKVTGKVVGTENVVSGTTSRENEKVHEADPPVESAAVAKKGVGRPGKSGRGGVQKQPENSAKGRKRARR